MTSLPTRDLKIVILLTILVVVWILLSPLGESPLNWAVYLFLILMSAYSILSASYPPLPLAANKRRFFLEIITSIILLIIIYLSNLILPYPNLLFLVLAFLTIILSVIAFYRRIKSQRRVKRKGFLVCQDCGGYYQLKEGEYLNNFESCQCGGKLEYQRLLRFKTAEDTRINEGDESKPEEPVTPEIEETEHKIKEKKSREPAPSRIERTTLKEIKETRKPSKKIKRPYSDLLIMIICTLLCLVFVLLPPLNKTFLRTLLGLLLVLFLPGYTLIAALFPKKTDLDGVERLALSFGLSIAVTPLIGLILNYTPWGIRLEPILISLSGFTLILCLVAFLRRRRLEAAERFHVDFSGFFQGIKKGFSGETRLEKVLSIILVCSIILAISTTIYLIVTPKQGEKFTEFYILGPEGKASNYPTNLTSNSNGTVIIGIVNHEYANTTYLLRITSNGNLLDEYNITLTPDQKYEFPYTFTVGDPGQRKLEFLLYKQPNTQDVYRSLHLWLNVT